MAGQPGREDKMANSTSETPGSAPPSERPKPSLAQAFRTIFSKEEDVDQGKVVARRRKFVMAAVLGSCEVLSWFASQRRQMSC